MRTKEIEELVKQVIAGDELAFNKLYEQFSKLVYYIAYKQCLSDADAKDIVQETFIEVQRTIHSLQNPAVFKFWLNRITLSKCKNLYRKNKYVTIDTDSSIIDTMKAEERTYMVPQKSVRQHSDQDVLNRLIDELPRIQREVLVLYYLEQFRIDEIAHLLDVPQGTVKSRLSYARESLKKKVELYERTEKEKLSFYSLSEAIPAAMAAEMVSMSIPTAKEIAVYKTNPSILSSALSSTIGKVILCAGLLGVTGTAVYHNFYQPSQVPDIPKSERKADAMKTTVFPKLTFKGKEIDTSEGAYFNLKYWLCCEEEMQELDKKGFEEAKPVYEALREQNQTYYTLLKESGWATSFEALYEKFTSN